MTDISVGPVARWVVGDPALTHIDHTHLVARQVQLEFGDVLLEEFDRLQLVTRKNTWRPSVNFRRRWWPRRHG